MSNPYIISVSSQKGGVGKTTVATNLSTALRMSGYRTLLVDFDFINPSVSFYLGLHEANLGIHALLSKSSKIENVVEIHPPSGLHVIIGELGTKKQSIPTEASVVSILRLLRKTNYQFIIIDTAPGHNSAPWVNELDEAMIITTPDVPACASATRESGKYNKIGLKHSLIVNKATNARYELSVEEIRDMYGGEISGILPNDTAVSESLAVHIPTYLYKKRSNFSRSLRSISEHFYLSRGTDPGNVAESSSILSVIKRLLHRLV